MSAFLGMSLLGAAFISGATTDAIERHRSGSGDGSRGGGGTCAHCCRDIGLVCTKVLTPVTAIGQKVIVKYVVAAKARCVCLVRVKLQTPPTPDGKGGDVVRTTLSAFAIEPPYTRLILELGPANCLNVCGTFVAEVGILPICRESAPGSAAEDDEQLMAPSTFTFEKNECALKVTDACLDDARDDDICGIRCKVVNRGDFVCKAVGFQITAVRHHDGRCVTKTLHGPFTFLPGVSEVRDLCLCRYDMREILSDACGGSYDICIFVIDDGGRVLASCWCDDELQCH